MGVKLVLDSDHAFQDSDCSENLVSSAGAKGSKNY